MRTSDTVLLVGGSNEAGLPSHYSWSYNFINGTWTLGPPLWESRYGHFCGKFKAYQNNRTFAVVAGKVIIYKSRSQEFLVLEPVCCKKRPKIVPDQLLVWEIKAL